MIAALLACADDPCPDVLPDECPDPAPTFAADVDPILARSCRPCHVDDGEAASVPLDAPGDIDARRTTFVDHVYRCTMPPAGADVTIDDDEREVLLGWVVCTAR